MNRHNIPKGLLSLHKGSIASFKGIISLKKDLEAQGAFPSRRRLYTLLETVKRTPKYPKCPYYLLVKKAQIRSKEGYKYKQKR